MENNPLLKIKALGQSIWLDYIRRDLLEKGELASLIAQDGLAGVTSNPSIFEQAISQHHGYDTAIEELRNRGVSTMDVYENLVLSDVQQAADVFRDVYTQSQQRDGYVSLEVSPHLAYDTQQTIKEARRLWAALDRPNVMIKVPATRAGLPAITQLIAEGINLNVTLLFSIERYRDVMNAWMSGLEARINAGQPVAPVASVASFFVSRIDVLVDKRLHELALAGTDKSATQLSGQAAVASARMAYQHYKVITASPRWQYLSSQGAQPQRLLWASTGTKNPAYSDIKYIEALIAQDTVNTVPPDTLAAYRDHGEPALRIEHAVKEASELPAKLAELGIDLQQVSEQLEADGVQKFIDPFDRLLKRLSQS